ncbi:MAG: hypothetical protein VKS61_06700 [Candidatus Sericytochromatia bacterium]|nr:hypothetical protein [Candidatus Sericytochromatia bacterium]
MRFLHTCLVVLLLSACQLQAPVAEGEPERRAALAFPVRPVKGQVMAPPGLIGVDGGTLIGVDGGTLIGVDGGSLIGVDGGTLRLAQAGLVPLGGAAVVLAGPDGVPVTPAVTVQTDAQGRFTLRARLRGGVLLVLARGPSGAPVRLSAIPSAAQPGGEVAVTPATTAVSAALMAEAREGRKNFSGVVARDYEAAVEALAGRLAGVTVAQLADVAGLAGLYRAAAAEDDGLRAGFERLKAALSTTVYDEEPAPGPAASTSPTQGAPAAGAGANLVALPPEPVVPTATPDAAVSPSAGFEPTPAPTTSPPAVGPAPDPAEPPFPAAPAPAPTVAPRVFKVPARVANCEAWYDTGMSLEAADVLTIRVDGVWRWSAGAADIGPEGDPRKTLPDPSCFLPLFTPVDCNCVFPLPGKPLGALVMKTDGGKRLVGRGVGGLSGLTGRLRFRMNDSDTDDNGDSVLTVTVTTSRQP